ncbi:MAG TPA: hypothetical protein VEJ63_02305 [Planctomycetota bacterium]|nr:hypothetical protein [Planctomycetota bacterium]
MRAMLLCVLALFASAAVNAADCYVSDCRVGEDGIPTCYNEPVDCCAVKTLECAPQPIDTCVACEDGSARFECATTAGEPVDIVVREEPLQVSDEWNRGGLAGEGNDTGLWPRSGHYSGYRMLE